MDLEFTCQVLPEDVQAASKRLFKSNLSLVRILVSWILFLGLFMIVRVVRNPAEMDGICACRDPNFELTVAAAFSAAWLILNYAAGWFNLRKRSLDLHAQNGTLDLQSTYNLTLERFHNQYAEGTSDHPWVRFSEWMDADSVLLLHRGAGLQYIIPKRCLSQQQLDDLIALFDAVGVKRK